MNKTWLMAIGKNTHIGQVELGRLAEHLLQSTLGRTPDIVPFFRYRRLIIMIDTPREKSDV